MERDLTFVLRICPSCSRTKWEIQRNTAQSVLTSLVNMSEKLCLQWNDFNSNVNKAFGNLREDNDFSDVTLASEDGRQVEAHKVLLAAASPFFKEVLLKKSTATPWYIWEESRWILWSQWWTSFTLARALQMTLTLCQLESRAFYLVNTKCQEEQFLSKVGSASSPCQLFLIE